MAFTLETKLHILLIMIVIGISLYMYLLYKEVKVFQDEIIVIKAQIAQMQISSMQPTLDEPKVCDDIKIIDEIDDDNHSVTSNEIKNILTNIQETDEDEVVEDEVVKEEVDFATLTEEELQSQNNESLRDYLRSKKKSIKGTKAEMIKRILEV